MSAVEDEAWDLSQEGSDAYAAFLRRTWLFSPSRRSNSETF